MVDDGGFGGSVQGIQFQCSAVFVRPHFVGISEIDDVTDTTSADDVIMAKQMTT